MAVPTPPMTLEGHCSVIYSNTLYVYSAGNFASIPLQQNVTWRPLASPDQKVTNPACVKAGMEGSNSEQALYVVGGTGGSSSYSGLQRYSFSDEKWEVLGAAPTDMTDRTSHGVGYLESASKLLVYAGDTPSSSTYLISTSSPYTVDSQPAQGAPVTSDPMLLTWSPSQVALIGGTQTGTAVYVYDATGGWALSGVNLPSTIPTSNRCTILLDSKKKILEEFNLSADPNTVNSYELVDATGSPQTTASLVGASSHKRSSSDYPTYNGTFAPGTKRSDYSLAQGDNGMVVVSGGGGDNSLAMFNSTTNSWMNATELFHGSSQQHVLKPTTTSTTSTSTPTATSTTSSTPSTTATSSSAPAASGGGGTSEHTKVIIGATLGSLCGFALILLALLFLLRRAKQKNQAGQGGGGDSKDRLSFQDQGIEPLTEGAYPMAQSPVPVASASADSLAIMSGRTTGEKSLKPPNANAGYGLSTKPGKSSPLSTIPSSGFAPSSIYSTPELDQPNSAATGYGNQPGDRTTDEGWGRYFEDNNTNLAGTQPNRMTASSVYTKSDYRGSAWPMANLAPLNLGVLDQPKPLGRVNSGSPTTEYASNGRSLVIPESQSARISSADSLSLASEDDDPHDTNWTGTRQTSWLDRPASSNYSTSFYNSSSRDVPSQYTQYTYADQTPRDSKGRQSSVVIPDDIHELPVPGRSANLNSDMSWLNLNADR